MPSPSSSTPSIPEAIVVNPPEQSPEEHAAEAAMISHREKLQEAYRRRAEKLSPEELLEAYVQQGLEMRETHDDLTWLAVELCWATDGSLGAARRQVHELVRRLRERAENAEAIATQAQELLSSIKVSHDPFGPLRATPGSPKRSEE